MPMPITSMVNFVVALLVITNPFAAIPIFLSLTAGDDPKARTATAIRSTIAIFIILEVVSIAGLALLHFFGINIGAFKVAGGIIILSMGLSMLHSKQSTIRHNVTQQAEALKSESIAVVPIALPLMAGPGAMSTIITWSNSHPGIASHLIMAGLITIVCIMLGFCLVFSSTIGKCLGKSGLDITTKIMGMLLAAIAIQMIASGLIFLFPFLQG